MSLFFISTVMAILPVYTTSKLHAARINLRQTPCSTPGVLFNYVKGRVFLPEVGVVCKIFAGAQARPTLWTPLREIVDPSLLKMFQHALCESTRARSAAAGWFNMAIFAVQLCAPP